MPPVRPGPSPLLRPRGCVSMRRAPQPPTIFIEAAQEARFRSSSPAQTPTSLDRPADVWIPHGADSVPEAWNFAVTSCLRPAPRNPVTPNLADCETHNKFHDAPSRCHDRDIRFTPAVFDGHAGG